MALTLKIFSRAEGAARFMGRYELEGERVTVGRSVECTLQLPDPERKLSRVHVEFLGTGDGYRLRVASAHSSVMVNGRDYPPGSEATLRVGDALSMDVYDLDIVSVGASDQEPIQAAPAEVPAMHRKEFAAATPTARPQQADSGARLAKQIGIGAAAIAVVLVLFLQWPRQQGQIKDLTHSILLAVIPDGEAEKKIDQKIALLDEKARRLVDLLESDKRQLKEAVADSMREVERLEELVRTTQSSRVRASLDAELREARNTARINSALENKLRDLAEGANGLPKAEGNLSAAAAAVKGRDKAEAIRMLEDSVDSLTRIRTGIAADRSTAQTEQERRQSELRASEASVKPEAEERGKAESKAPPAIATRARARPEAEARTQRTQSSAPARPEAEVGTQRTQSSAPGCLGSLAGSWVHPVGGTWTFNGNQGVSVVNSINYGPKARQITVLSVSSCENETMTYKIVRAALINTIDSAVAYDKTPANEPGLPNWAKVYTQPYSISGSGLKFGNFTYARP